MAGKPTPNSFAYPLEPPLSVIIPVHNGGRDFERCLRKLYGSQVRNFELIVVDDGSRDGSGALARRYGARVLRQDEPLGPASARNLGARVARGEILVFLDADVMVHRDTLSQMLRVFEAEPNLSALFGSYDTRPAQPGLVSQYRNLLHHYVHQQGEFSLEGTREVQTFWSGCGAVRRSVFLEAGGFNPKLYHKPAIEDIELGYRLSGEGHRILLARDVQVTHLKRWTLANTLRTDILLRGVPWLMLLKRMKKRHYDLNLRFAQRICVAAASLGVLAVLLAWLSPWLLVTPLVGAGLIALLNMSLYRFFAVERGRLFALGALPLHYLYYCCCAASVILATLWSWVPIYHPKPEIYEETQPLRAITLLPDSQLAQDGPYV